MSSSEDFSTDRHVFGGENNNWCNFDMPGKYTCKFLIKLSELCYVSNVKKSLF